MKIVRFLLHFFPLVIFTIHFSNAQSVAFDDKRWVFESQAKVLEGFQGKNSLYLAGGKAYLKDEKFSNGIIEYDTWLFNRTSFSGVVFRILDSKNYEELYLRSQQSGQADAFQYTPVFNGNAGWQLYHDQFDAVNDGFQSWKPRGELNGYNAVYKYPFDRWLHVKILIKDTQAELYLDNKEEPVAFIPELKRGESAGSIGIEANAGAVYFANFSYKKTDDIVFKTKMNANSVATSLPGSISQWQVSNAFKENDIKSNDALDEKFIMAFKWQNMTVEKGGFINLSRLSAVSDSTNTILASIRINSDKEQIKKIIIGYSDRVKVYCNNTALYSGTNEYRTRDFRYLGTIGFFDTIYLPLKKGENTIVFAVSETFGGWGIMARLEDLDNIRLIN